MGAPTESYVDPSIAADTGAGTSTGDPAGDLQGWLDRMTRDATDGDRLNVKAGTDELLAAILNLTTYGVPTQAAPLIIQGYTSAAGDGGIGGIDAQAGSSIITAGTNRIHFIDMHTHNCGANIILSLGSGASVQQCELDNGTAGGIVAGMVIGNHLHNISGTGISAAGVFGNYLQNGTNDFTLGINVSSSTRWCAFNILSLDGASNGISINQDFVSVYNNSVFCAAGTGDGIQRGSNRENAIVLNNVVEGFSGAGGAGFNDVSRTENHAIFGHNATYNNTTNYENDGDEAHNPGDNEALGASPFDKTGSDTFANRFTYFAPVDTGNMQGGAYPSGSRHDKGAVQHADPAGGGGGGFIDGIQRIESGLNL